MWNHYFICSFLMELIDDKRLTSPWNCVLVFFFCRKVWDALSGDELHSFEHKHIVRACAFSEVKLVP